MTISVALAAYNGEKYIVEQLESIRLQSRKVDQVIICDDQSTDRTVAIVRNYIKLHDLSKTWHIEVNQKNVGYASNFIQAVDRTAGDLIMFCDQDDIWKKNRVKQMAAAMESHPQIMLLGSEYEPFRTSKNAVKPQKWELRSFKNDDSLERVAFNAHNIFIGSQGCTMCMRRDFYQRIRPYWYPGWAHDEFVWKMALCLDGLYLYHNATLKRRLHEGNVTLHKMHQVDERVIFLNKLNQGHKKTMQFAKDYCLEDRKVKLLKKNIIATNYRVELLLDGRISNVMPLTFQYWDCYHKQRAIPVELLMAIKYKTGKVQHE